MARRLHSDECGATLLEFAFSCGLLLMAIVGFFEFALAIYTYLFVVSAAQQGARYAIVRGAHWASTTCTSIDTFECNATSGDVQTYVRSLASPGITSTSIGVSTQWPAKNADGTSDGCTDSSNSPGCEVEVVVTYPFSIHIPFVPSSAITISSTSKMVVQQ